MLSNSYAMLHAKKLKKPIAKASQLGIGFFFIIIYKIPEMNISSEL